MDLINKIIKPDVKNANIIALSKSCEGHKKAKKKDMRHQFLKTKQAFKMNEEDDLGSDSDSGDSGGDSLMEVAPPGEKYEKMIMAMKKAGTPKEIAFATAWKAYNKKHKKHESVNESEELWMQSAVSKPGALHKQLGIPEDEKIPTSLLNSKKKELMKKGEGDKKLSASDRKLLQRINFALNAKKAVHESFEPPYDEDRRGDYADALAERDERMIHSIIDTMANHMLHHAKHGTKPEDWDSLDLIDDIYDELSDGEIDFLEDSPDQIEHLKSGAIFQANQQLIKGMKKDESVLEEADSIENVLGSKDNILSHMTKQFVVNYIENDIHPDDLDAEDLINDLLDDVANNPVKNKQEYGFAPEEINAIVDNIDEEGNLSPDLLRLVKSAKAESKIQIDNFLKKYKGIDLTEAFLQHLSESSKDEPEKIDNMLALYFFNHLKGLRDYKPLMKRVILKKKKEG